MNTKNIRRIISVLLVLILAVIFSFTTRSFLDARNLVELFRESALVGIVALGASFVIIGGGIDLSTGGIVTVSGLVCARLSFIPGIPGALVLLAGVLTGVVCGLLNAVLVTRVHLTEFVATLASGFVYSGLAMLIAFREGGIIQSRAITNASFTFLGGKIGGIYNITAVWVVLMIVMMLVLTKTTFGLHTYAQGSNARSALMSGVNNDFIKGSGFVICGACAGLAAAFVVAKNAAAPVTLGSDVAFEAIAACVVGGLVLGGGRGDAVGAFLGGLFMQLILNGIYKYNLPIAYQWILMGAIIVLVTAFDAQFNKLRFGQKKPRPVERKEAVV
ncbi:ribose transport system permease protein [Sporobacter termitidis DSM 10068]|uniref:Autoinducer 2 import system permease protein LsrD n=1 Tax=Sporobacter termitidis DSM 10068 TaxID=1123282 RepID=A0A1M5YDI3_9FIRM|nr:ABC transporter permease [Sporobacter termitidis]SHI10131.1 ribose transport system permease protein [Sporobacter termitidis DSM 10068]